MRERPAHAGVVLRFLPADRFPEAANGRGLKANRAGGAADPKGPAGMPGRAFIEAALIEAKATAIGQQPVTPLRGEKPHSLPLRGGRLPAAALGRASLRARRRRRQRLTARVGRRMIATREPGPD